MSSTPTSTTNRPASRLDLSYEQEARRLGPPPAPIIDVHTHLGGLAAARIYQRAATLYGVELTYSMSPLEQAEAIRDLLDGRVRFIAVPNYWAQEDRHHHMTDGFLARIEAYHAIGSRIAKFWAAPRSIDYAEEMGDPDCMRLDAPHRIVAMEAAAGLGMAFMVHIADPDTWFASKYSDASKYGTKKAQYEPFERLLDRFRQPWIAAHMAGWPEDLDFLTGLLDRHQNLYLDTSACKWMVRELSRHTPEELRAFLARFDGRILFGSDIVTSDDHLEHADDDATEMARKAASPDEAFELYASRYWALRHLFETGYDGPSPIADPDLALVEPDRYTELDAPPLRGMTLPRERLVTLYHDTAHDLLEPLHAGTS
ncbi:MAG: amidohydrolase family protein [Planctomycetota bacterium]|jgi:hypothetical protein